VVYSEAEQNSLAVQALPIRPSAIGPASFQAELSCFPQHRDRRAPCPAARRFHPGLRFSRGKTPVSRGTSKEGRALIFMGPRPMFIDLLADKVQAKKSARQNMRSRSSREREVRSPPRRGARGPRKKSVFPLMIKARPAAAARHPHRTREVSTEGTF